MNSQLLKGKRVAFGFTQPQMANMLNISLATYKNKENMLSELKISEASKLKDILNLTSSDCQRIFFDN